MSRILHVTPYLSPAWAYGEVPAAVGALARRQATQAHRVTVLTTDAMAPHERQPAGLSTLDSVRVIRVRNVSGAVRTWLHLSTPLGMTAQLQRVLREDGVDVVHLHELCTVENLLVTRTVPPDMPLVLSLHGTMGAAQPGMAASIRDTTWAARWWDARAGDRILRRLNVVVVRTHREANAVQRHAASRGIALRDSQFAVVPDGVDLSGVDTRPMRADAWARFAIPTGPVIASVGPLAASLGVDRLVAAFAHVVRALPEAHLLIAGGDRGALADVQRRIRDLDLEPRVRLAGYLAGADVNAAYAAADVVALPGTGASTPRVALEALACGVPVLLGSHTPFTELSDAGAGRLVEPGDDVWGRALVDLLRDRDMLASMRVRAMALADRYRWPAVAARMDEVYAQARTVRPVGG
jgi:glycosyltransferase involved in cell wall biosynthesis